jgi:hypothetical protein
MCLEQRAMLDQVTDQLFIGKARLAYDPDRLHRQGITSVVKLFESPPDWPSGFNLLDAPFEDGVFVDSDRLAAFDRFIAEEIEAGRTVLVVCGAGISRSATVVLSYLVSTGVPLPDAYRLLKARHPATEPHPEMWLSLIAHHDLPYTLGDVIEWRGAGR